MKILKLFAVAIVVAACAQFTQAVEFRRAITFEDAYEAACRVSVSGARGSGTFIGADGNNAYILTNYHVVSNNATATLEFWSNSILQRIQGKVIWRYYDVSSNKPKDFALIVVDAERLKAEIDPPYMPIAGPDVRPTDKSYIISSGAPDGRFVQAWKGQVTGYYNGETVEFQPPPVPGQSGSGIISFYDDEPWLTAVLTWLFGEKGQDDSKGGAIPIANFYEAVKKKPIPAAIKTSTEGQTPSIPENATECAAPDYTALVFTAADCPACTQAAPEIAKISKAGIVVKKVNVRTQNGSIAAQAYSVTTIPTVVVVDDKDDIQFFARTDEINANAIVKKINDLRAQNETEPECDNDSCPAPIINGEDFRYREAVYERLDETGIIEKAEQFWRSRRGCPPQEEPKIEEELPNDDNDSVDSGRLIGRLTNNIVNKLGERIDSTVDKTSSKFMAKIDDVSSGITTSIQDRIDTEIAKAKKTARRNVLKYGFLWIVTLVLSIVFSNVIVSIFKKICSGIWNRILKILKEIVNANSNGS